MEDRKVEVIGKDESVEEISRRQIIIMQEAMKAFGEEKIGNKEMDLLIKASDTVAKHMANIIKSKAQDIKK